MRLSDALSAGPGSMPGRGSGFGGGSGESLGGLSCGGAGGTWQPISLPSPHGGGYRVEIFVTNCHSLRLKMSINGETTLSFKCFYSDRVAGGDCHHWHP